jgi:hypothetical protein
VTYLLQRLTCLPMANPFKVSSGEFGYILKRQSFLFLQDVLSKCVFSVVQQSFPASSPKDEIFVHLDLRLQESVLQRWDGALSVSSSLHVLSQLLPNIIESLPKDSIGSPFSSLLIKLQEQLQQGFHGINSFASVILLNDSSLFSQSRQDMVFVRGILEILLPLDASLSASIQAAVDNLDSCLSLAENPFQLCSAAAPSLSCVVFVRALVSLCEAAERHQTSIEVRRNPARSLLWAFTAVAEHVEQPVSSEQFKFLHDSVVEIGCCYEEFVTARMLDAAGIMTLLLDALKASDEAAASVEMRSAFLDCFARHSDAAEGSRTSLVLQATSSAISSCPYYISSIPPESSLGGGAFASALNHSKTGYVSLPWHPEWQCISKLKGNIKLLMQIDLCSKVLKLVPAFHNKTATEIQDYLCKSHATAVVRNVSFALDQVNEGCTGIMGMLISCGHALAKILSPDSDAFIDGGTVVSFDASSDDGVFPLLVHVVLARLQGGYNGQSCACVKNYSSIFDQASSPSIHAILSDFISGKVSFLDSVSSMSTGESPLHVTDAVAHLVDLASRLCQSNYFAPMRIPTIASPCLLDKIPPSKLRRHELCVSSWDSDIHVPLETSGSISPSELDKKDLIVSDEEVDAVADSFNFSSTLSNSGSNFRFFLFYGEHGTGKTFQSIRVVQRIHSSRKNRGLRFHWHLIDCSAPECVRSSFIQSARSDVNVQDKVDVRASPHDVAAALSKYLEGIQ